MRYVKLFLYYLVQWTWGIFQNVIGLILTLACGRAKREFFHGALITYHNGEWGGVSLGMFVIMNGRRPRRWIEDTKVHEYGHTVQSLIFGPLYLFVIGIPSMIWCNSERFVKKRENEGVSYYAFYPESGANRLGAAVTGLPRPKWSDDVAAARLAELTIERRSDSAATPETEKTENRDADNE